MGLSELDELARRLEQAGHRASRRSFDGRPAVFAFSAPVQVDESLNVFERSVVLLAQGVGWQAYRTKHGGERWHCAVATMAELEQLALDTLRGPTDSPAEQRAWQWNSVSN